jgi:hypothetical protein
MVLSAMRFLPGDEEARRARCSPQEPASAMNFVSFISGVVGQKILLLRGVVLERLKTQGDAPSHAIVRV